MVGNCFIYQNFFFQTDGTSIIRIGRHSSLPKSISKDKMIFEKSEKNAKFSIGPTLLIPGPMLLKQAVTEVNVVAKSLLSKETSSTETIIIIMYMPR